MSQILILILIFIAAYNEGVEKHKVGSQEPWAVKACCVRTVSNLRHASNLSKPSQPDQAHGQPEQSL